ncbi:hypothetical protein [Streptomyces sp. KL2]|uniref:hypothetical protein n=1 Tax=Streptomyces sp. KL2 TaxID=3050126 RepID=UPI00397E22C2
MFRVISGGTHRRYTEAVQTAGRVPGLEADLADTREQLTAYRAQHKDDQEQLVQLGRTVAGLSQDFGKLQKERAALRRALDDVAAALVAAEDSESACREAARLLARHHESADLVLLADPPRVHLYLYRGQIRSAPTTYDGAVEAAGADGADPGGWFTAGQPGPADASAPWPLYLIRSCPVRGPWPDGSRVYPVAPDGGLPLWVFGAEEGAVAAARAAFASWRLTPRVTELEVTAGDRAEAAVSAPAH